MVRSDPADQVSIRTPRDEKPQSPSLLADEGFGEVRPARGPSVFVFNPFAEGHIALSKAYAPVKHQALLAEDLANLPQFLCEPGDVVLVGKRPAAGFQDSLKQIGFPLVEFVELREGCIDLADRLCQRKLGSLQPWAWGPDSVTLLEPLFANVIGDAKTAAQYFNNRIAQLYSKAWSADFLRKVLARCGRELEGSAPWLCTEQEAGIAVDTLEDALATIAAIRGRGHHRVVAKEALGLAGHNAIRLWEPDLLPEQRQWLTRAVEGGRQLVIEPWLERELDFSVQLEMGSRGLKLCGYTGLFNDRKGQFLANWAEADYAHRLPANVVAALCAQTDISSPLHSFYGEVFSLLETELQRAGFLGPVSMDAFVYRTPQGDRRLKPVVEINPRYTMGRLTVELMKHACPGCGGLFRLVTRTQARRAGCADLRDYARALGERLRLQLEGEPLRSMRQVTLCLNDPHQAQVCLATFEVSPTLNLSASLSSNERWRSS